MNRGFSSTSDILATALSTPESGVGHMIQQIGRLTDTMVAELSGHFHLDNLANTVAAARTGEGAAYRKLVELSLGVDIRAFDTAWTGSIAVSEIREALRKELAALKFNSCPQPGASRNTPSTSRPKDDGAPLKTAVRPLVPFETPPWKSLATKAGFPIKRLDRAQRELLEIIDRVLVRGEGWGPKDQARGRHLEICLHPSKLAHHGGKRSPRTYQRAIAALTDLGLIRVASANLDQTRNFVPTWWMLGSLEAAINAWKRAAAIADASEVVSDPRRTVVALLADACRTPVAPPVRASEHASYFTCTRLWPVGVRHLVGRSTSDISQVTHDMGCPSYWHRRARSAPCLPEGQARRAGLSQKGQEDEPTDC